MSYDINVVRSKDKSRVRLRSKHGIQGGTYAIGGTDEAWLNITYNYSEWFCKLWPERDDNNGGGIRSLYGRPIDEVIEELDRAIGILKGEPDEDYWAATEGNAREALFELKLLCELARHENQGVELELYGD